MEKNTAALTGAFVHVYLKVFSFFQNFFPEDGGHLPGERDIRAYIRSYMTKTRVFSFRTFLELAWHLQSTRSRRLVNEF